MNKLAQRICTWCGPIGFTAFGIGIIPLARFLPPPSPSAGAEEIAALYHTNQMGILFGSVFLMLGVSLLMPFFAQWAVLLKRIEGRISPYTYTLLILAAVVSVLFYATGIFWSLAAFRPERPAELILLLNDTSWFFLNIPAFPGFVHMMAIGLCILSDKSSQPVMPRWTGYATVWIAVLLLPACLLALFKTGPFAWDGVFGFWLPAVATGTWSSGMVLPILKSIANQPDVVES